MNIRSLKQKIRFWFQRRVRGWDDGDTWSLDTTTALFLIPRLKRYKELNRGYPNGTTPEEWNRIIDEMIVGFEVYKGNDNYPAVSEASMRSWELLGQYAQHLWW